MRVAALVLLLVLFYYDQVCYGRQSDALSIDAIIQSRHLPFGGILDPIFSSSDSPAITGYTRCGDSALWTGHYLAAQAYRYKVSGDPAALANAQAALAYLKTLVDVTGTDLLARCVVPINSNYAAGITSEESANGIHESGDDYWVGNTSRDEYVGVFFGLSIAYDLLGAPAQPAVQALATRMLNFLMANGWSVVMPDGSASTTFVIRPDEQLGLLQMGRQVNSAQFGAVYETFAATASPLASLPVAVDCADARNSYFKFNLDAVNLFTLIRLETDSTLLGSYQSAYQLFHNTVKDHGNAHFNMVDRALNGAELQARSGNRLLPPSMALPSPPRLLRGSGRAISLLRQLRSILQSAAGGPAYPDGFSVAAQPVPAPGRRLRPDRKRGYRLHTALLDGALLQRRERRVKLAVSL